MDDAAAKALESDRVVDITTIGRHSGESRRIEIWFHRLGDRFYITGTPDRPRSWYANLVAHPAFTFHLKKSATADLPATARPVTDPQEREEVFTGIFTALPQLTEGAGNEAEVWIARSPLVEVDFAA
ncbi:MAG TPA: nitroreductase/quinone reductase family protein [Gryllotalpicola sp.]